MIDIDLCDEYDIPHICWNCKYLVDDYNVSEDYSDEWLVFYCGKEHVLYDEKRKECEDKVRLRDGISI